MAATAFVTGLLSTVERKTCWSLAEQAVCRSGADDPIAVTRAHAEALQGWMIDTRPASTALKKHKSLPQFFKRLQSCLTPGGLRPSARRTGSIQP